MTSVHPGSSWFGRAPIGGPGRRRDVPSDADYDDPSVVAANLDRALRAARARLTGRPRRR